MMRQVALLFAGLMGLVLVAASAATPVLPIYIEDNHAGSFHWLAAHLDLDEEYTLIHFDAHSDASGIFDSDEVRNKVRRVFSLDDRRQLLEEWRRTGAVQCFNWIEPLMPLPFAKVIWIPSENLSAAEAKRLEGESVEYLDAHLEAAPRRAGSFEGRYHVMGLSELGKSGDFGPLVVTIDLDFFAGMEKTKQAAAFERVWKFVSERKNLRAITIAVSRPYLSGDEEADRLLTLALEAARSLPTATVEFEPFAVIGNDRSQRAQDLRKKKEPVPAYDVTGASEVLRTLFLEEGSRIIVRRDHERWRKLLEDWAGDAPRFHLTLEEGFFRSTDGIWRVPVLKSPSIELVAEPWDVTPEVVDWEVLVPQYASCNLISDGKGDFGFATDAPARPRWQVVPLDAHGQTLDFGVLKPFFDSSSGCGSVRLKARVRMEGGALRETAVIEIRRFAGTGVRAAITEQFGLPYLFGSGELRQGTETGPETGLGADCANFVVYALRRNGVRVPWCNPKQLRRFLKPVASPCSLDSTKITEKELEGGLLIHLGNHVAVVMEDRPPLGILDGGDRVAHHLEGFPEIISLGALLEARGKKAFDVLRVPVAELHPASRLVVGGDVMLGRTVGEKVRAGADPFAGIRERLDIAALKLVNLECVISEKGTPTADRRFWFRAPLEAARRLRSSGIDAVGLANNHAEDFGGEALLDCVARLREAGVTPLGAGSSVDEAMAASLFSLADGRKVALFAVSDLDDPVDPGDGAVIARAVDRSALEWAITQARREADYLVCLVHWGEENTPKVTDRQRSLARWLIDHGADVVAGAHPHCIQPLDFYHGRPVAYSLGNLVFDGGATLEAWSRGQLMEIDFGPDGLSTQVKLVPVVLDKEGFPHVDSLPER